MSNAKPMPEHLRESVGRSKCEYRQLGRSGLRVSVPILGAMSFGSSKWMDWLLEEDKVRPSFLVGCSEMLNAAGLANPQSSL